MSRRRVRDEVYIETHDLCPRCGKNPIAEGRSTCDVCRTKRAAYYSAHRDDLLARQKEYNHAHKAQITAQHRQRKDLYLDAGICPICMHHRITPGYRSCQECRIKLAAAQRERLRKKKEALMKEGAADHGHNTEV